MAISINAILDHLQSRQYCEAIMDDLLLFTKTKNTLGKIRRYVKGIAQDWMKKYLLRNVRYSEKNCHIWETSFLLKKEQFVQNY